MDTNVNIPLLRKAVEWAEAEAAKPAWLSAWNQRVFVSDHPVCGTAFCIAGWVGHVLRDDWQGNFRDETPDGQAIHDVAAEALGIDPEGSLQPGRLFYTHNTIEDVRRIAEEIAGERL